MSQETHFSISRGELLCDCLPQTYQFIEQNLSFFHGAVSRLSDLLDDAGAITFVSNEESWSFACCIEKTELGTIAAANGVLNEGGKSRFDEILGQLTSS